ncbi:hypothetical protein PVAP13_3KG503102 [Panicum virgatum]|uniref:Uncharacterized protein n=1 Tax=Panicum virgatum TaxID=38727 RepID=A0A8T0VBR0_PANVG|nr:hypothetical protein PVAP13_3KG503102 [Panicum virgatum]
MLHAGVLAWGNNTEPGASCTTTALLIVLKSSPTWRVKPPPRSVPLLLFPTAPARPPPPTSPTIPAQPLPPRSLPCQWTSALSSRRAPAAPWWSTALGGCGRGSRCRCGSECPVMAAPAVTPTLRARRLRWFPRRGPDPQGKTRKECFAWDFG